MAGFGYTKERPGTAGALFGVTQASKTPASTRPRAAPYGGFTDNPWQPIPQGPFSAYCEATVIDKHALEATGGLRFAELDREDPKRQTAQTASFLQASLFTSVVAFGAAAMAILIGVLFILIGLGIRDVSSRIRDLASRTPATA